MRKLAMRSAGVAAALALVAAAAQAQAPQPGRAPAARPYIAPNTVILFPFENNAMVGGQELSETLATAIKAGLTRSRAYSIASFYPASPLVQRARQDQAVARQDIETVVDPTQGTVDPTRAATVAQQMGARYALLGSIEAAEVNPAANRADVTATVQLIDTLTGTPTRTAGVTGTATLPAGATQQALLTAAAREAAARALAELGVAVTPEITTPPALGPAQVPQPVRERKRTSFWLPLGILLGVLVAGVQ